MKTCKPLLLPQWHPKQKQQNGTTSKDIYPENKMTWVVIHEIPNSKSYLILEIMQNQEGRKN